MEVNESLVLHFIQFNRHGASVNRQIVSQLLPIKRNGKILGALKSHLLGKKL